MKRLKSILITLILLISITLTSACGSPVVTVIDGYLAVNGVKTEYLVDAKDEIIVEDDYLIVNGIKTEHKVYKDPMISVIDGYVAVNGLKTKYLVDTDDEITVEDEYLVVNGVKTEYKIHKEPSVTIIDGYLAVNGVKTEHLIDTPDEIVVEDGYLVVNGIKTEYKIYSEPEVTVIDGYVAVNGVKTEYLVDTDDEITVEGEYLVVNGTKTEYKVYKEPTISVIDGYLAVNGVKTTYKVQMSATEAASPARQAFVYDYEDGLVFSKGNMNDRIYPASITKLVTAMVVIERASLDTVYTAGDELSLVSSGASSANLKEGQSLAVRKLLEGLLLPSGCDAAYTLAANVGKVINPEAADVNAAVSAFVGEMNAWAKRNGLTNSFFKNPDGFHAEGHYSSMQDILTVAKLCKKNETIMSIVGKATISSWKNTNKLLHTSSPYYNANCIGFKTGTTTQAGNCLLSCFTVNGKTLIIGVFGTSTTNLRFEVTNNLYSLYKN